MSSSLSSPVVFLSASGGSPVAAELEGRRRAKLQRRVVRSDLNNTNTASKDTISDKPNGIAFRNNGGGYNYLNVCHRLASPAHTNFEVTRFRRMI